MTHVVVLAGGWGERLWPLSTRERPKQLLDLLGEGTTLLRATLARVSPTVSADDAIVMTSRALEERVARELPEVPRSRVIGEPAGRNTAPAIALAAHLLLREDPDATMVVLPADHIVRDAEALRASIVLAVRAAESGLVTLGITPTRPETEYGYIKAGQPASVEGVFKVDSFEEKPGGATARGYLERGGYYWNSGMFVWRADRFLEETARWLPDVADALSSVTASPGERGFREQMEHFYGSVPSVSVDYGVMEKADDVLVVPSSFGWDDVGSWPALLRIWKTDAAGNALRGDTVVLDSSQCVVCSESGTVAVLGLRDVVVVRTADATLVMPADRAPGVREIVKELGEGGQRA
jgi:mannose-1-phosphate guanylyltransferase